MKLNLKYPANWQDFENLCFHLWKSMWGDYASHPNGRSGQRQDGVDIFGKAPFDVSYTGIQCKGKNGNYDKQLSSDEIDEECNNAKNFKPKLGTFVMATTSPRNVKLQEHCRELNSQKIYKFEVDTWSWDDIMEEVQCRPDIMKKFYPDDDKNVELVNEVRLSRITSSNKLHAFFSRPGLLDFLNRLSVDMVENITYELATNAFEHGKATYFNVNVEGRKIIYKDDGYRFNPKTLLEAKVKHGGGTTLKHTEEVFSFNYQYENENVFELTYMGFDAAQETEECYTIDLNVQDVFGRNQTEGLAFREISKIPGDVSVVVVDIIGKANPAISIVYTFFDILQKLLKPHQNVHVYLPNGLYYYDDLSKRYESDTRFKFILKN